METNRDYLSYSQLNTWLSSPKAYYKKYALGIDYNPNRGQAFGKRFMEDLEYNNEIGLPKASIKKIDLLEEVEVEIRVETPFSLLGFVDSLSSDRASFREYKTGQTPWTQRMVDDDLQIPFYGYLIWRKYGVVPTAKLIWIETVDADNEILFTGKVEVFERKLYGSDIKTMERLINKVLIEIEEFEFEPYEVPSTIDEELGDLLFEQKMITDRINAIKDGIFADLIASGKKYGTGDRANYTVASRRTWKYTDTIKTLMRNNKAQEEGYKRTEELDGRATLTTKKYLIYKPIKRA